MGLITGQLIQLAQEKKSTLHIRIYIKILHFGLIMDFKHSGKLDYWPTKPVSANIFTQDGKKNLLI